MDNLFDPYGDPLSPRAEGACSLCGNAFHSRSQCPWGRSLFDTLFGRPTMPNPRHSSYHEELATHLAAHLDVQQHPKPRPAAEAAAEAQPESLRAGLERLFDLCEQQYQRQVAETLETAERQKSFAFAVGFFGGIALAMAVNWAVKLLGAA